LLPNRFVRSAQLMTFMAQMLGNQAATRLPPREGSGITS
jgi:hypothetical protein